MGVYFSACFSVYSVLALASASVSASVIVSVSAAMPASVSRCFGECFSVSIISDPADILNCFSNCPADNSGYQSVLEDVPGRHL